jgi:hypothetical protein
MSENNAKRGQVHQEPGHTSTFGAGRRLRRTRALLAALVATGAVAGLGMIAAVPAHAATAGQEINFVGSHCPSAEFAALKATTTKITVQGENQNGAYPTWTAAQNDRDSFTFVTDGWWWVNGVVITIKSSTGATWTISAYVPANMTSMWHTGGSDSVEVGCWGTQTTPQVVHETDTAKGFTAACFSSNQVGQYTVTKNYVGPFYYTGHMAIDGSQTIIEKTAGTYSTVRNLYGDAFVVPLNSYTGSQEVCTS